MKLLSILVVFLCLVALPLNAAPGDGDGPAMRCNCHMCPVARAATLTGFEVVSTLTLVNLDEGEFLV